MLPLPFLHFYSTRSPPSPCSRTAACRDAFPRKRASFSCARLQPQMSGVRPFPYSIPTIISCNTPFYIMTDHSQVIVKLLKQLSAQNKTNRAAVKAMNDALEMLRDRSIPAAGACPAEPPHTAEVPAKEPETALEPEARENPSLESEEEAFRREFEMYRRRIMFKFQVTKDKRSSEPTPDFDSYVMERDYDQLLPLNEFVFRAMLSRDFSPELAEAYRRRTLGKMLFRDIVQNYDYYLTLHAVSLDEELMAEAKRLQEAESNHILPPLKPTAGAFRLHGRKLLESFFNEEVVDIVNNHAAYRAMGVDFPEHFVLEGAPGCGKTYAVEALARHLGWYTVHITSASVGSELIHETPVLIEQKFAEAADHAPAIIIIDEMEAFLPSRTSRSADHHAVQEEVASFLKCIQAAAQQHVLVVGMTNYIEKVDPAILRSGRLGRHITVEMPDTAEVESVLAAELDKRPHDTFPLHDFAESLQGSSLSDLTALVHQASMQAVRNRHTRVQEADFAAAMAYLTASSKPEESTRSFGFAA